MQGFIDPMRHTVKDAQRLQQKISVLQRAAFLRVTAKAITQNEDATEKEQRFFKFTDAKITLGELSIVVNDHIGKDNDFLPELCVSHCITLVLLDGGRV